MRHTNRLDFALLLAALIYGPAAQAHPGHAHGGDVLAQLAHSITGWGAPLALLIVAGAVCALWLSRGR